MPPARCLTESRRMIGKVLEITFVLVLVYLVVSNASGFSQVVNAIGGTYASSVKALQAR